MSSSVPTKAIIAAAGYGTRMLPATKVIEKCMMPLLNRPVVDYIVQDLIKAGVKDIYFVVNEGSNQIEAYYSRNHELEKYLKSEGKNELLEAIRLPKNVNFHYVVQKRNDARYGTAIALWLCRKFLSAKQPFFFVAGDQTLWRADGSSEAALLREALDKSGKQAGLIGVEVPAESVDQYGIIATDDLGNFKGIVEKPPLEEAPSNLLNASFYLLPGTIMKYLEKYIDVGVEGEYWIVDVLNGFASDGNDVHVQSTKAAYLDCGSVEAWVMANELLLEYGPRIA